MHNDVVIKAENLSKIYPLYARNSDRLREALHPLRRKYHQDFYALDDVSFEIKQGETIGILGQNGSGKSTLLKIITGVLTPSSGSLKVSGRISSLLELGTGFNPELTGSENVFFFGTINGMDKRQITERYDDIVGFADIGEFVGQPVKTYSSGMFVRLAFACAINVDPDILIIDEALAVGDARFQKKCFKKIHDFKDAGKTILFVTHDTLQVKTLTDKALLLERGKALFFGDTESAVVRYFQTQFPEARETAAARAGSTQFPGKLEKTYGRGGAELLSLKVEGIEQGNILRGGEKISIRMEIGLDVDVLRQVAQEDDVSENLILSVVMENTRNDVIFGTNTDMQDFKIPIEDGKPYEISYDIDFPYLRGGKYFISISAALGAGPNYTMLAQYENIIELQCNPHDDRIYGLLSMRPRVEIIAPDGRSLKPG